MQLRFADLELGLHRRDAARYLVELRFSQPDGQTDIRVTSGDDALVQFDFVALRELELDNVAYGRVLTACLFASPALRIALAQVFASVHSLDIGLRVRLFIGPSAPELHTLRWEMLRHPDTDQAFLLSEQVLFSRYLASGDWRPIRLRPRGTLRALVVVANPTNLDAFHLPPIDVHGELERARVVLTKIPLTELAGLGRATLKAMIDQLRQGFEILYLVCHGGQVDGKIWLWLEDEAGQVSRVSGLELAARLQELTDRPCLVVLASCQSAFSTIEPTISDTGALAGLGPQLAESGIPAVLAMQGTVTISSVAEFMPVFFAEIQRDGQLDRAVALARGAIREQIDYWMPVLFLRLRNGCIWTEHEAKRTERSIPPPPKPTGIPEVGALIGRAINLESFTTQLSDNRRLAIIGMPGIGKTALAATIARQASDVKPVFWHQFHENEGINALIWDLAAFLAHHGHDELWRSLEAARLSGAHAQPVETQIAYLIQALSENDYLLCLDDVHLVDDSVFEQLVARLQHEAYRIQIILIARELPEFVESSAINVLEGLNIDSTGTFLANSGLQLPEPILLDLYKQTGGNPYLLVLAADLLKRTLNHASVVSDLLNVDNVERFLQEQVDQGLETEERVVMQAVSVLLGYGGTRDAIGAILDLQPRRWIRSLVGRGLLIVNEGPNGREHRQHALLQHYYYDEMRLLLRNKLHLKAAEFFVSESPERDPLLAATHFHRANEQKRAADIVVAELWTIINRGGLTRLVDLLNRFSASNLQNADWAAVLVARGRAYGLIGQRDRARIILEEAIAAISTLPSTQEARRLTVTTSLALGRILQREKPIEALSYLQQGLAIAYKDGLSMQAAMLQVTIAAVQNALGESAEALASVERALTELPADPSPAHIDALLIRALLHGERGHLRKELHDLEQAWSLCLRIDDPYRILDVQKELAMARWSIGDWDRAIVDYQEALAKVDRLGVRGLRVLIEYNLGNLALCRGDADTAQRYLTNGLADARQLEQNYMVIYCLSALAELSLRLNHIEETELLLNEAGALVTSTGLKEREAELARRHSELCRATKHQQEALYYAELALSLAHTRKDEYDEGLSLRTRSEALLALGKNRLALEDIGQSLQRLVDDPFEEARSLMRRSEVYLVTHEIRLAAEDLKTAHQTFVRLGAQFDIAESASLFSRLPPDYQG